MDVLDNEELISPHCDESLRPYVGQIFCTLSQGEKFYKKYARASGFATRKSTINRHPDGSIRERYMLCNREGVWQKKADENLKSPMSSKPKKRKRKTTSCRVGCHAKVIFECAGGGCFRIRLFNEGHTHKMVPPHSQHLMPSNREVGDLQQMLIVSGLKANIGPMRTFRLLREIAGSYEDVGCTSNDFKNFVRDFKLYGADSNAKMLLEAFTNKQELGDGFKFCYELDEDNKLRRLIWSDKTSIQNFKMFGECVSFDATYNTNRFKMIFTPFTGRDNHGKCISFGAAIISGEDMESYSWVLDKFAEIMGQTPRLLITDQDPALKKAVAASWKETRHRFCMWHITMKVAEKLPKRLGEDPDFKTNFDSIVWSNHDEPEVFEEKWNNMIKDYDLASNKWFSDMFDDRTFWIPAYFRDVPMSSLFRTTSLSESENSYFKRFISKNSDLVLLYTNYCSAIDSQRHTHQKLTLADETRAPMLIYNLAIEEHASKIYTHSVFKKVQDEIRDSLKGCTIRKLFSENEDNVYVVEDNLDGEFTVRYLHATDYISCSCNMFIMNGTVCRHMFLVFRNMRIDRIPERYVLKRWCKYSIINPDGANGLQREERDIFKSPVEFRFLKLVCETVGYVKGDDELTEQLYSMLVEVKDKFANIRGSEAQSKSKERFFSEFYGSTPSESPSILPPDVVKTKGSGAGGRRKSHQEKAMLLAQKPLRLCRRCNTKGHHDSRNCPTKEA